MYKEIERNNCSVNVVIDNFDYQPRFPYNTPNLKRKYKYLYCNDTLISELFDYLVLNMYPGEYESLKKSDGLYMIKVGNEYWRVQLDYKICDFMLKNDLDAIHIVSLYGTGGGGFFKDINANIRINPNEGKHKYVPHVHIYRGKTPTGECSKIKLDDLSHMEGKELSDMFNKREKAALDEILHEYQQRFIDYYVKVQSGMAPEPMYINFRDRKVFFH